MCIGTVQQLHSTARTITELLVVFICLSLGNYQFLLAHLRVRMRWLLADVGSSVVMSRFCIDLLLQEAIRNLYSPTKW